MLNASFRDFCAVLQRIADTRSLKTKTAHFSEWLSTCQTELEIRLSCQWSGEGAFSKKSTKKATLGPAVLGTFTAEWVGIDYESVFKTSKDALGSTSETIEKLLENIFWFERTMPDPIEMTAVVALFDELLSSKSSVSKRAFLAKLFTILSPLEIKYFIRIAGQNSLRIGFEWRSILQSIANSFELKPEAVFDAYMLCSDLGETAVKAKKNQLETIQFELFQPIPFMLASPYSETDGNDATEYVVEQKLDGIRAQLHLDGSNVAIFSRDLNKITSSFPDLADEFASMKLPKTVFDGEILAIAPNGRFSFSALQQRLGVKAPTMDLIQDYPTKFVAYDVLFSQERLLLNVRLSSRRMILERLCANFSISISDQKELKSSDEVKRYFQEARLNGFEGLMLKKKSGIYESGQRKKLWLKVKEPARSFTTVILYAHAGSGKRGGTYSDFTLGIRKSIDSTEFIPIGKAYGGYTNEELLKLNQALKPLVVERFGPTLMLKPAIIVEIEYDEIQINNRTKAGFTLRFPRFKTIRWDLGPLDADSIELVKERFETKK